MDISWSPGWFWTQQQQQTFCLGSCVHSDLDFKMRAWYLSAMKLTISSWLAPEGRILVVSLPLPIENKRTLITPLAFLWQLWLAMCVDLWHSLGSQTPSSPSLSLRHKKPNWVGSETLKNDTRISLISGHVPKWRFLYTMQGADHHFVTCRWTGCVPELQFQNDLIRSTFLFLKLHSLEIEYVILLSKWVAKLWV